MKASVEMRSSKGITALIFILLFPFLTRAQVQKSFPAEPDQFVREVIGMLEATRRSDCAATADAFAANYKAGALSGKMPAIQATASIMLGRSMLAYPHFELYLRTVNDFVKAAKDDNLFQKWSDILDKVTKAQRRGETRDFKAYLEFSGGLFREGAVYISDSKSWFAKTDNFTLHYDSVPKAVFPGVDLMQTGARDTIIIKGTSGVFFPLDLTWKGKKGRIDWTRAGFAPDQVYADIDQYTIDVSKSEFTIDSVTFYNKLYFDFPLKGRLTDRLTVQKDQISYPRFESFRKDLTIKDLSPNVKYQGGFSLEGNRVIGSGDDFTKAILVFFNQKGEKVLVARSRQILLRKTESLSADKAEISLYLGKDSIYHPGLNIVYKINLQEVNLYRGESGIAATPFFDSYHQHEIKTDAIVWKVTEPYVNVKMISGAGKAPATFTSSNFFRKGELEKFQGVMDFNPVSSVYTYSKKNDTREILADDLAKKINPQYTENTIKGLLYNMVQDGFIFYDEDRGLITVRDKVFNYIAANGGLIDFDVIKINSFNDRINGRITFDKKDIMLTGVKQVLLSDSQNVFIYPDSQNLEIQKNKDMAFSGRVLAGRLDFLGTGFHFEYDTFLIDLTKLASALIYVPSGEKDKYGNELLAPMTSRIEGLTGYLNIDKPNNKSGKKDYPQYPIFTNLEKSYVYYDDSAIHKGAYVRNKFYFLLDPFVFDSLDTFDPYLSDFEGDFHSADIFPVFRENLKVQKDLSFGFRRTTPEKGYPIYKGKGTYNDSIFLSNAGLRGKGRMKYLFNKFESDSIIFFPDSMDALAQTFQMEKSTLEGVTFPPVKGYNNKIHWLPYADSMFIAMTDSPFLMYDSATLRGSLLFTRKGLKGDGEFDFREATLASRRFNFESESLNSDTLSLVIKSIAEDKVTFNTPNVRGRVDFKKREGEFKSNLAGIPTEFANNQYKTSINEFFWDMDGNFLDFKAPPGTRGVYFTSTRPDQDSLKFLGKRAFFDMSTSIIDVDSVPEVRVADASIAPDKKRVTIMPGGLLDTLMHAVVVFDTTAKKNRVYNAKVIIQSKNKFTGDGIYDYKIGNLKPYPIIVHDMGVKEVKDRKKTLYYAYANGSLMPDEHFMLHPKIEFKGTMSLTHDRKRPYFSGFGKLKLQNTKIPTSWFAVSDEINTDTFFLHYDHPLGEDTSGTRMFTGIYYSPYDSLGLGLYTSVMCQLMSNKDLRIFDTRGVLKYDDKTKTWIFGDENKVFKNAMTGNVLQYNEQKNTIKAEGKIDFNFNFAPVQIKSAGTILHELDSGKYTFNTLLAFSIPLQKDLVTFFSADLNNITPDRPLIDYTKSEFEKSLAEIVDAKRADKVVEELHRTGQFLKPKDLDNFNLVLGEVKLLYEPYYQTYRSVGPVGVSFIGATGVHKKVKGYVELGYRKGNDFFNIYFEGLGDSNWYFLSFNNKTLQLLSGNKNFNMLLASIVPQNRNEELANEEFYLYTATTYKKMQDFLFRMRQIEKGIRVVMVQQQTEEEIFEEELEQIKKELLKYQPDTTQLRQPESGEPQQAPQTKRKGKKEPVSFIDQQEAVQQEVPDYMPASRQDIERFLRDGDTLPQNKPLAQPDDKSKKKKGKVEEAEEADPYAEDEQPQGDKPEIKKGKAKEAAQPQEEADPYADDKKSDFEQIMEGGKKKKKKDE